MKLLNKLLPAATIATVAAASPFIASCSNSSVGARIEWDYKANGTYSPQVQQAHLTKLYDDADDICKVYFEDLNKNRAIFADDYFYYRNVMYYPEGDTHGKVNRFKMCIECTNVDVEKKEISFTYDLDYSAQIKEGGMTIDYEISIVGTVNNFKYFVTNDDYVSKNEGGYFQWDVVADYKKGSSEDERKNNLVKDKDWSIDAKVKGYYKIPGMVDKKIDDEKHASYKNVSSIYDEDGEESSNAFNTFLDQISEFGSNYLANLNIKDEE